MSDPLFVKHRSPSGYTYTEPDGVGMFRIDGLSAVPGIEHCFSARSGGVSTGPFESMNLSFTREAERENVVQNYRLFCRAANIPAESLVLDSYEHGSTVRAVDRSDCGRGFTRPPLSPCDGLVTDDPLVTLSTGHADCMAFFAVDPVRRCIGLAHAGWRGTVGKIGEAVIDCMTEDYGCDPTDIIAVVGPAIGACCYEVDSPVFEQFASLTELKPAYFTKSLGHGKYLIDLKETNRRMLMDAGLLSINITISDVCTKCNSGLLYSHRASGGKRGGLIAMMCIK